MRIEEKESKRQREDKRQEREREKDCVSVTARCGGLKRSFGMSECHPQLLLIAFRGQRVGGRK